MTEPKKLTAGEFRELGYLQEVNRRFFHPLGLAMAVHITDDGDTEYSYIIDARDDPEGFCMGWGKYHDPEHTEEQVVEDAKAKALFIDQEFLKRLPKRRAMFGGMTQPICIPYRIDGKEDDDGIEWNA